MNKIKQMMVAVVAFAAFVARSADLDVPAGETVPLSGGESYDAITVRGTLSVGSGTVTANSLTIADHAGGYGSVSISGGAKLTVANAVTIAAAENSSLSSDAVIDTISVSGATLDAQTFYNESGYTNRISFVGNSTLDGNRTSDSGDGAYFNSGATVVRLVNGAKLVLIDLFRTRSLNATGASVVMDGEGSFEWRGRLGSTKRYLSFDEGAVLDFNGELSFDGTGNDQEAAFSFNSADVFGANVKAVTATNLFPEASVEISIGAGVALAVPDMAVSDPKVTLFGQTGSSIVVGALPNSSLFSAGIPSGDPLSLVKTGASEVVIFSTTNLPHLAVSEGTLRITDECVVEDVTVVSGASLIADGCTVTLKNGFNYSGRGMGNSYQTANGGRFVTAVDGVTTIFDPSSALTGFHFAAGSNVFSRVGIDKKYWRFTFMKTASNLLNLRGLYLFDENGTWINELGTGGYVAPVTNDTELADGKYRFYYNSATNVIAKEGTSDNQNLRGLRHVFSFGTGNNYFPVLTSPVLNESDPLSWLSVEFALTNGHERATGYNLRYYNQDTYMQTWKVFASDDCKNWVEVDARNDETATRPGAMRCTMDGVQYDKDDIGTLGAEYYTFSGYRTDGLVQTAPFALQADGGAAVDLRAYTGGATVNELTIDLSTSEGGTIYGAKLAESGMVNVILPSGTLPDRLPLVLPDAIDSGNLQNWQVIVNGEASKVRYYVLDGNVVRKRTGIIIFVL